MPTWGTFGRKPIRMAWFGLVLPALTLNYFGQGALLLRRPSEVENLFFLQVSGWAQLPLVLLATVATVIASQAVITGAYSITRQAIQLGYLPRLHWVQTSAEVEGQVYMPGVNWALYATVVVLILAFGSSDNMAAAYGIAVTGTMGITTVLATLVARRRWGWSRTLVLLLGLSLLAVDLIFFSAASLKVAHGGWFPLAYGAVILLLMTTWKRGRTALLERLQGEGIAVEPFLASLALNPPQRVDGTAVFFSASPYGIPHALLHNLKHNKVLHQRVVLLTVFIESIPHVLPGERVEATDLGEGFHRVKVHFGFKDDTHVPHALLGCTACGSAMELMDTSFFLSRETIVPALRSGMPLWRERLFAVMARNAANASNFYRLPRNRVVELGAQVEL